jgi:lipopolysaccharide/colanic/teichoic acid biosynthesis glycosyltransferase
MDISDAKKEPLINPSELSGRKRQGRVWKLFLKRAVDISVSLLGLLLLWPVFVLIVLSIKWDSPGPVFFKATRVGQFGKRFQMLKFRSMYEQPEESNGAPLTTSDDERVTPIGKWLRVTKINELPQLWNVLVGEMSLVGPRPEDAQFVERWSAEAREKILSVRPGITSPASIVYRDEEKLLNGDGFIDAYLKNILPDKLRLDQLYVDNHTFIGDIDVLFMTLIVFLPTLRSLRVKERWLFSGVFYTVTHRVLSWFLVDLFVVLFMIGLSGLIWRLSMPLDFGVPTFLLGAFLASVLMTIINSLLGLHRIDWSRASPTYTLDFSISVFITLIIIWLISHLSMIGGQLPFALLWLMGVMVFIGLVGVRYRERLLTGLANRWILMRGARASFGERMLIVGAGELGELAIWMLNRSSFHDLFAVIGMVDDDPRKRNLEIMSHRVLGSTQDIPELVDRYQIGLILFAISNCPPDCEARMLALCNSTDAHTIVIPDLIAVLKQSLEITEDPSKHDPCFEQ